MAKKDCIREMFYVKGLSISEIAREAGHDRKTVRQYVNREDWNLFAVRIGDSYLPGIATRFYLKLLAHLAIARLI